MADWLADVLLVAAVALFLAGAFMVSVVVGIFVAAIVCAVASLVLMPTSGKR